METGTRGKPPADRGNHSERVNRGQGQIRTYRARLQQYPERGEYLQLACCRGQDCFPSGCRYPYHQGFTAYRDSEVSERDIREDYPDYHLRSIEVHLSQDAGRIKGVERSRTDQTACRT